MGASAAGAEAAGAVAAAAAQGGFPPLQPLWVLHIAHRSLSCTPARAEEMCCPQPFHVGLEQSGQLIFMHISEAGKIAQIALLNLQRFFFFHAAGGGGARRRKKEKREEGRERRRREAHLFSRNENGPNPAPILGWHFIPRTSRSALAGSGYFHRQRFFSAPGHTGPWV